MKINTRNRLIGTDNLYANNTLYNVRAYRIAYSLPNAVLTNSPNKFICDGFLFF